MPRPAKWPFQRGEHGAISQQPTVMIREDVIFPLTIPPGDVYPVFRRACSECAWFLRAADETRPVWVSLGGSNPIWDYALPISVGGLTISLMTNQAYDTSSRRCSPREIIITPASPNLCPVGQVFRGTYHDRHRLAEKPVP